jgi:hypothetical protein
LARGNSRYRLFVRDGARLVAAGRALFDDQAAAIARGPLRADCACRSSALTAFGHTHAAARRLSLASRRCAAYSPAIDSAPTPKDSTMNATPITLRFNAFVAAAAVTLAMLAGIDTLTGHEAPLQMAATAVTPVAS